MNQCIFCGKEPGNNDSKNFWAPEHIIPKALGNDELVLEDSVCKDCNSKLGSNVDAYFLNNFLVLLERQTLNLKGQSGKVPNPFIDGTDQNGNRVIWKGDRPGVVPKVEIFDNHVKIIADTIEEAQNVFLKKAERMNLPKSTKDKVLESLNTSDNNSEQLSINVTFGIEFNRFFMEAAKIAYEFAFYKLGKVYLEDPRAIEIREYLNKAIRGEMKDSCPELGGVMPPSKELMETLKKYGLKTFHMIMFFTNEGSLYSFVSLFMDPLFSFCVFLSEDASKYQIDEKTSIELIEVKS